MEIIWLGHGDCQDCTLLGGKGANLCHLTPTHRIPHAFCLTAAIFRPWQSEGNGEVTGLSPELYAQLAVAYRRLGELCGLAEPAVAVRSSAVEEDGLTVSFAGQHSTWLNVTGLDAVAQAIVRCWTSAHSPHVLAYRRHHGLGVDDIRIAVLVQQMILADVAVVVFSANPVTGSRSEVVLNASWGLGESLVSGAVTPDIYTVRKHDLTVQEYQPANKHVMTVPIPGGTRQVLVPRWLRTQPVLTLAQILELAQLALHLEATMEWPVDLECVYRGGVLYLLQCRPITGFSC